MGSNALTLTALHECLERIKGDIGKSRCGVVYCHPLEYPFIRVLNGEILVGGTQELDLVIRWFYECKRKYFMGLKTNDSRWTQQALIDQYTNKISKLRI